MLSPARRLLIVGGTALCIGGIGGLLLAPTVATAAEPEAEAESTETPADPPQEENSWLPILGSCLGVAFGGALAVWQIRGMKNNS